MKTNKKILVHFDTNETKVYALKDGFYTKNKFILMKH